MEDKINHIKSWLGTGSINIFGVAFAGKDTVGERLAELLGSAFLSSGNIIREARNNAAEQDNIREAAVVSETGVWMPTDEFRDLVLPYLYSESVAGKSLVLSMVGRWYGEETPVMEALKKGNHDTKAVVLLNLTFDKAMERRALVLDSNSRNDGRYDDMDENRVRRRFHEFTDKTSPVIEVYRQMGILLEIDGDQGKDAVFENVIDSLYEFSQK